MRPRLLSLRSDTHDYAADHPDVEREAQAVQRSQQRPPER